MSTKTFTELLSERGVKPVTVAAALGVDKSTVSRWCNGLPIPAEKLKAVEDATGIPASQLRPDLAAVFLPTPVETESAA